MMREIHSGFNHATFVIYEMKRKNVEIGSLQELFYELEHGILKL